MLTDAPGRSRGRPRRARHRSLRRGRGQEPAAHRSRRAPRVGRGLDPTALPQHAQPSAPSVLRCGMLQEDARPVASGGAELFVREGGSGPALVCLHAGVADHRMFEAQLGGVAGGLKPVVPSSSIATSVIGALRRPVETAQYACEPYRKALAAAGITPSMSRKGSCLDNAPMESFFHSLKVECVHHHVYATRAEARRDLFVWIEGWYNSPPPPLGAGIPFTGRHGTHGGITASTKMGHDQRTPPSLPRRRIGPPAAPRGAFAHIARLNGTAPCGPRRAGLKAAPRHVDHQHAGPCHGYFPFGSCRTVLAHAMPRVGASTASVQVDAEAP